MDSSSLMYSGARRDSDFLDWVVRRAAGTLVETSGGGRGGSRLQG